MNGGYAIDEHEHVAHVVLSESCAARACSYEWGEHTTIRHSREPCDPEKLGG